MKHAGEQALDALEDLLRAVRKHEGLRERKRGAFYQKSAGVLLAAIGFFMFWARTRFWLPRYVHFLAAIGLAVSLWGLTTTPDDAPINQQGPIAKLLLALALPAMVYFFFVFYGGQRAAFERRLTRMGPCPYCNQPVAYFHNGDSATGEKVSSSEKQCPHCGQNLT